VAVDVGGRRGWPWVVVDVDVGEVALVVEGGVAVLLVVGEGPSSSAL
jgi:hypothetical protein